MDKMISTWQRKLLPVTIITIVLLTIFFVVFFCIAIKDNQNYMSRPSYLENLKDSYPEKSDKWQKLYNLEKAAMQNRYYFTSSFIRMRMLIISLAFLSGMTLCFFGTIFILSKFSENSSTIDSSIKDFKVKIISTSPGIILIFFGIILISIALFTKVTVDTTDKAVFLPYSLIDFPITDSIYHKGDSLVFRNSALTKSYTVDSLKKDSLLKIINKY